jgi:lysophosphatidiate acyltransferase
MLTLPYYLQSLRWIVPAFYAVWGSWRVVSAVLPVRVFEAGDEMLYSMYQRMVLFCFENLSGIQV